MWSPAWVSWCWWPGYVGWAPYGYYSSWYWGRYHGWGWGWGHHPDPPGSPGGGHPRPPRGDVVPPRSGAMTGGGTRRESPEPRLRASADPGSAGRRVTPDAAADFTGRVRVSEMDRAGWNVVAADDFASEHVSRLVRPGSRVLPDQGDATGVVVTGPLTTRPPSAARTSDEISRTFRDVAARTDRDITRVMARDPALGDDDFARLVQPTTLTELGRSSAQSVVSGRSAEPLTSADASFLISGTRP